MAVSTKWPYPLMEVTEDKRTSRTGVAKGFAHELVGIDGNSESGLRPSSGFKRVYELSFLPNTNHDLTSKVLDFFPVHFSIGSDGYAYGFVYRVRRSQSSGASLADIFLDYYNSKLGTWSTGNIVMEAVSLTNQWSTVEWGRFVYLFVKARSPAMFYIKPSNYALMKIGDSVVGPFPGPGKRPLLTSPERGTTLGTWTAPSDTDRPASAQICILTSAVPPSGSGLYPGPCGGYNAGSSSNSISASECEDCTTLQDEDTRLFEAGDYTFAYQLMDSATGRRSALSEIAQCRTADWAEVTEGSDSTSTSDDTVTYPDGYMAIEMVYDSSKYDQALIYRSVKIQDAGGTYIGAILQLDKIIDLTCLASNLNGTGLTFDPAVTNYKHIAYWYELEDKQLVYQDVYMDRPLFDEVMPKAGTAFMYENTLLCTNIGTPPPSTDDENRTGDQIRGLGELRWSSLSEATPELFSPSSRYVPSVPSAEILRLEAAGSNVMGFSRDRMFFVRKDSTAIRVVETHKGFGISGPDCAQTIGSTVYFLTAKGLKTIDASTQLDDIRALNYLTMVEWLPAELSTVSFAFDPATSSLFMLNPTQGKAAVIWFNTSRISEFVDLPFLQVKPGVWPITSTDYTASLTERALWLQEYPRDTDVEAAPTGWKPRIYVYDYTRTKVIAGTVSFDGQDRITTMDIAGDTRLSTNVAFGAGVNLSLSTPIGVSVVGNNTPGGGGVEGMWVYVVESSVNGQVLAKAQVKGIVSVGASTMIQLTAATAPNLYAAGTLPSGSRVVLSPMFMRWTGSPLGVVTADGQDFGGQDYFRLRRFDTLGATFSDVGGPPDTDGSRDARFFVQVYRGDAASTSYISAVRAMDTGTVKKSIANNESLLWAAIGAGGGVTTDTAGKYGVSGPVLTPSVTIVCPDLDFRLLGVLASGEISESVRSQIPS